MIDATKITNYNLTRPQLEEHLLFWVCAAGKNGVTSARCLDVFLKTVRKLVGFKSPFKMISALDDAEVEWLPELLKESGIGCYNQKAQTFRQLYQANLDLKSCTVSDLEAIKGIGPKTARCFLIHSRLNQRLAGLDTHILKFLRDSGIKNVPKSTPTGKRYRELEIQFIDLADKAGKPVAEFDLEIWNRYRNERNAIA